MFSVDGLLPPANILSSGAALFASSEDWMEHRCIVLQRPVLFLRPFPHNWGRRIEFSISTLSGVVFPLVSLFDGSGSSTYVRLRL